MKFTISDFDGCEGEEEVKALHGALIHYYRTSTQDDYQPFDDPYILYKYKDNANDGLDLIMFSVLLGDNLQLLIRGYTPSNFWYVVFTVLPLYLIRYFVLPKGEISE